jgi:hypothetical protein
MTTKESPPGDDGPNTPRTGSGAIRIPGPGRAGPVPLPLTVFPPSPDAEWRPLAQELGIPDDVPWGQAAVPGEAYAPNLSGYIFWFFGVRYAAHAAPAGPFVYVEPPGGGPRFAFIIQAWQTLVMTGDGSPLVAEVRWHPERGTTASIRGLEHGHDARGVERVRRGLAWLQDSDVLRGGGRPRGSKKGHQWTRQDFIDWYREARQSYATDGVRITQKIVGEELGGLSADTARNRLDDVGLPWPPWSYPDVWDPDPDA